jgi:hypothetical protein
VEGFEQAFELPVPLADSGSQFNDSTRFPVTICPNVAVCVSKKGKALRVEAQTLANQIALGKKRGVLSSGPEYQSLRTRTIDWRTITS